MGKGSRRSQRTAQALAALRDADAQGPRVPASERVEDGFVVRSAGVSERVYRCPGCAQEVARVAHVVAWPVGDPESRRHWHSPCWAARARRTPTVERGRGPRR
ncbi:MAG: hypothetical protein WCD35_12060 [Mycobacteriales bacterium]